MIKISDKDKNDWKNFIDSDEKLLNKDKLDNINQSQENYKIIDQNLKKNLFEFTKIDENDLIYSYLI